MKYLQKIIVPLFLIALTAAALTVPAFALTESEVEAQVSAIGKEAVTGNVLIWFLCAVGFLKVSQKIDSFMSSLGVNVGHTGGSMLSDAMIAMRTVAMATGSRGGRRVASPSSPGASGGGMTNFFQGGLAGIVSRKVTNDAIKTAVSQQNTVHTAQGAQTSAIHTAHTTNESQSSSTEHNNFSGHDIHTSSPGQPGGTAQSDTILHTDTSAQTSHEVQTDSNSRSDGIIHTGSPQPDHIQTDSGSVIQPAEMSEMPPEGIIQTDNAPPQSAISAMDIITRADQSSHVSVRADSAAILQTSGGRQPANVTPGNSIRTSRVAHTDSVSQQNQANHASSTLVQGGAIPSGGFTPIDGVQPGSIIQPESAPSEGIIQTDNTPLSPSVHTGNVSQNDQFSHVNAGSVIQEGSNFATGTLVGSPPAPTPQTIGNTGETIPVPHQTEAVPSAGIVHTDNTPRQNHTVHMNGAGSTEPRESGIPVSPANASREQVHTSRQSTVERVSPATPRSAPAMPHIPSLGSIMFNRSLQNGGQFAADVIGTVARGDTRAAGTMTGEMASQALNAYMGIPAPGEKIAKETTYSQVEIGGGKITGQEITPEFPAGIAFGMYHTEQYAEPKGLYEKVVTADGAQWYKQYAAETVVKTPFKTPEGKIDFNKEIVKRLPDPPRRKDR